MADSEIRPHEQRRLAGAGGRADPRGRAFASRLVKPLEQPRLDDMREDVKPNCFDSAVATQPPRC